ncbi:MAG: carboxyltransferase domain-containing protein [Planctomycetota bacterium]
MSIQQQEIELRGRPILVTNYHDAFLLLNSAGTDEQLPAELGTQLLSRRLDFCDEVIATEREICLKLNDRFTHRSLCQLAFPPETEATGADCGREVRLPVRFEYSADWDRVCVYTGLTRPQYQAALLECPFSVAMIGFLPGFVYLSGLPDRLQVPRKARPDRRAAANSLAVGGNYAGLYSLESPAGWNVIGTVATTVLRLDQLPPVSLEPGDVVRLTEGL